jgi:hypothetical protein
VSLREKLEKCSGQPCRGILFKEHSSSDSLLLPDFLLNEALRKFKITCRLSGRSAFRPLMHSVKKLKFGIGWGKMFSHARLTQEPRKTMTIGSMSSRTLNLAAIGINLSKISEKSERKNERRSFHLIVALMSEL